jgi:hypothetical protein
LFLFFFFSFSRVVLVVYIDLHRNSALLIQNHTATSPFTSYALLSPSYQSLSQSLNSSSNECSSSSSISKTNPYLCMAAVHKICHKKMKAKKKLARISLKQDLTPRQIETEQSALIAVLMGSQKTSNGGIMNVDSDESESESGGESDGGGDDVARSMRTGPPRLSFSADALARSVIIHLWLPYYTYINRYIVTLFSFRVHFFLLLNSKTILFDIYRAALFVAEWTSYIRMRSSDNNNNNNNDQSTTKSCTAANRSELDNRSGVPRGGQQSLKGINLKAVVSLNYKTTKAKVQPLNDDVSDYDEVNTLVID